MILGEKNPRLEGTLSTFL